MITYKEVSYPSRSIFIEGYGRRDISTYELETELQMDMSILNNDPETYKLATALDATIFFYVKEFELDYTAKDLETLILMNI